MLLYYYQGIFFDFTACCACVIIWTRHKPQPPLPVPLSLPPLSLKIFLCSAYYLVPIRNTFRFFSYAIVSYYSSHLSQNALGSTSMFPVLACAFDHSELLRWGRRSSFIVLVQYERCRSGRVENWCRCHLLLHCIIERGLSNICDTELPRRLLRYKPNTLRLFF